MDKATALGFTLAFGFILMGMILGGNPLMYVDAPSVLIVFGGTLGVTFVTENMENVIGAFKIAKNAIVAKGDSVDDTMEALLRLARVARADGILALENEEVPTPFMQKGLRLLCDGVSAEELLATLETEMHSLQRRHQRGQQIFKFIAASAPAMGMIGTLVGLVAMLQNLSDPSSIGPSMAVALLTTLYGALIAFVIAGPVMEKLKVRTAEESMGMELAINGLVAISKGDNPMIIREKLNAFFSPDKRKTDD